MAKVRKLLFQADDGVHGPELWVTDGTARGTKLVRDINPGAGRADVNQIAILKNGLAVFSAKDYDAPNPHGDELWISDGTKGGTRLIKDIEPGEDGSTIAYMTPLGNGKAIFKANTVVDGGELWVTDGTGAGTRMVLDIYPGTSWDPWTGQYRGNSATPWEITVIGKGKAIFRANTPENGLELYVSDGTAAGTRLVKDINPGAGNSGAGDFLALGNGKAIFSASDGATFEELWITDGTQAGTRLVKDINPDGGSALGGTFFGEVALLKKGSAVFSAFTAEHGQELWVTDGTEAGTRLVRDINLKLNSQDEPDGSQPQNMVSMGNGKVLFTATDGNSGFELWVTNGTSGGTKRIADIDKGEMSSGPDEFTALGNGKFLFAATDELHGRELWITDGTRKGTQMVRDIARDEASSLSGSVVYIEPLGNGKAVFQADDGKTGTELWITDGTKKGTRLLEDINPGGGSSDPNSFTNLGGSAGKANGAWAFDGVDHDKSALLRSGDDFWF
jgi:ELWxxDGT repeat protein